MNDELPLPRFREPPVSEVAVGVQFPTLLNPVHLGLYYERVRARFPKIQVQPPIAPAFETFEASPPIPVPVGIQIQPISFQPRMWFLSEDEDSLIQLQSDRLLFNWRGGLQGNPYPHFEVVHAEFVKALDELEALAEAEGITGLVVNQCEVLYFNRLPTANTGVPLSSPEKIFRLWTDGLGDEWTGPQEDMSLTVRYRLDDKEGNPFGRLTATVSSLAPSLVPNLGPGFQLEMTARGVPLGSGREAIAAFHDHGHRAIVRCFAALTTPEMHKLWERYQ
jgi:uncharacterized protein (TIGR04255 family)